MQERIDIEKVFRPKLEGTEAIASALAGDRPDFIVLCSSLGSLLGGVGQADYYSANAYMDGWARKHSGLACKVVAINWDVWKHVGMALRTKLEGMMLRLRDNYIQHGIAPEEGTAVFARVLSTDEPQVVVSTQNLDARIERRLAVSQRGDVESASPTQDLKANRRFRQALSAEWAAPRNGTESRMAVIWERVLGVTGIGVDDNFFELGGNSLIGIQLLSRVREEFGVALALSTLLTSPTVAKLAALIAESSGQMQPETDRIIPRAISPSENEILQMVAAMTDEEVEKALAELE